MKHLSRTQTLSIVTFSALLLSACGTSHVPMANESNLSGTDFNHHLARNYRTLANFEAYEMYDWADGIQYADKAMASAEGNPPWPDNMNTRSIDDPIKSAELLEARHQLMNALNTGAQTTAPESAASAQANFDCWVEQQEEGWQLDDIAACKGDFWKAMNAVNLAMAPSPVVPASTQTDAAAASPPAAVTKPAGPRAATYLVFFDWDKSTMTPEGQKVVDDVVARLTGTDHTVELMGHTDTSGGEDYNMKLSETRAETVKQQLVARGVAPEAISIRWVGESGTQRFETANGVREARNRWVGVDLQGGLTSQ